MTHHLTLSRPRAVTASAVSKLVVLNKLGPTSARLPEELLAQVDRKVKAITEQEIDLFTQEARKCLDQALPEWLNAIKEPLSEGTGGAIEQEFIKFFRSINSSMSANEEKVAKKARLATEREHTTGEDYVVEIRRQKREASLSLVGVEDSGKKGSEQLWEMSGEELKELWDKGTEWSTDRYRAASPQLQEFLQENAEDIVREIQHFLRAWSGRALRIENTLSVSASKLDEPQAEGPSKPVPQADDSCKNSLKAQEEEVERLDLIEEAQLIRLRKIEGLLDRIEQVLGSRSA